MKKLENQAKAFPETLIFIFLLYYIFTGFTNYSVFFYVIGAIVNALLNKGLKKGFSKLTKRKWIDRPEPPNEGCDGFPTEDLVIGSTEYKKYRIGKGFPSGHSMNISFTIMYWGLHLLHKYQNKEIRLHNVIFCCIFMISIMIYTLFTRLKIKCHTYIQVLIGSILGTLLGLGVYMFYTRIFMKDKDIVYKTMFSFEKGIVLLFGGISYLIYKKFIKKIKNKEIIKNILLFVLIVACIICIICLTLFITNALDNPSKNDYYDIYEKQDDWCDSTILSLHTSLVYLSELLVSPFILGLLLKVFKNKQIYWY